MALISLQEVSVAFGGPPVIEQLDLHIEPGERIALLGRNGAGKSTLMKIMAGQLKADSGTVTVQKGINVTHLPQEVPGGVNGNVFDIVLEGLGARGRLLSEYEHLAHRLQDSHAPELMRRIDELQAELDHAGAWDIHSEVELVIDKMKLDPESDFACLSGGQKRRVLLAKALVLKPELLLLDEPTNHLDIEAIGWLEEFLRSYTGAIFFVTHDRMFMEHVATRVTELENGRIFSWACDYTTFLARKQAMLESEAAQRRQFEKTLSQEEAWIRQGVKARRCRNEGRVKALERMREAKKSQRSAEGQVRMQAQESVLSGRQVMKAFHVNFGYGERCLVRDFSTQITRGDKIGVIGPNGSGKTTLLRLLLGKLAPLSGKVRLGTNLEIAYFDQLREELDGEKTVMQNVSGESEAVMINGKARHVIGYLQEFLFSPDRARTPVKVLSGGERNRLLLARLFTRPFNFLIMDEPTNDLDIETLELLEELLLDYTGTLLLVSHDRAFLNNVVTSTMVLEGGGAVNEYPGGYDDWVNQRKAVSRRVPAGYGRGQRPMRQKPEITAAKAKLSFKEKRELESLPKAIEGLEAEQEDIYARLGDVTFCQKDPREVSRMKGRLPEIEKELLAVYQRWEALEKRAETA